MDAVLKGYLKYKAKGAWPKNWKELWFILRQKSDGTKQLEYYEKEKKSLATDAVPKGIIDLSKVMLIQRMPEPDKESQFIMNFSEGVLYRYFEAPSSYNMEEWVTALNAIIFSKVLGDVVFAVDLHQNDKTPFYGPCEMTLNDDRITVRRRQQLATDHQQKIQWNITHLKRFWVKPDVRELILMVGRQSPVGAGEFVFTTSQNVQIMHGITAMLNEAKRRHGLNMPMSAPSSVDPHTVERPISTSRSQSAKATKRAAISSVQKTKSLQPMSREVIVQHQTGEESYNVLKHTTSDKGDKSSVMTQPYSSLSHSSNKGSVTSPGGRKSNYDFLRSTEDVIDEIYEYPSDQPNSGMMPRLPEQSIGEHYGKLDHSKSHPQLPQRKEFGQQSEYGKLEHSEVLRGHQGMTVQDDQQYRRLEHSSRTPVLPQRRSVSQQSEYSLLTTSNTVVAPSENEYGKLDHFGRTPERPKNRISFQENEYGKLQHSDQFTPPVGFEQNEYGKLNHNGHASKLPSRRSPSPQPYEMTHPNQQADSEYGQLNHTGNTPELPCKSVVVQDDEYGKLEHSSQKDMSSSNRLSSNQSEYQKLQLGRDPSDTNQNGYGGLGSQQQAIYQNEPGRWTEAQTPSNYSVPRKLQLASNSVPSSVVNQKKQAKWNQLHGDIQSIGAQNYLKEFSTGSQKDEGIRRTETRTPSNYSVPNSVPSSVVNQKKQAKWNQLHGDIQSIGAQNYSKEFSTGSQKDDEDIRRTETQTPSNYSVPRKFQRANSVPSSVVNQKKQAKWNQLCGEVQSIGAQNYSKEFSAGSQVPSGYETFEREQGASINSAINSYSSDPEDNNDTVNNYGEYDVPSPLTANSVNNPLHGKFNYAEKWKKQKPTPKPRHT